MARTYHVLKSINEDMHFARVASVEASSGEQAIRLCAIEHDSGRYVAVPESNWTEVGVRVEIPAPRVIFENEPQPGDSDVSMSDGSLAAGGPLDEDEPDVELAKQIGDEAFQERKAELAARRAGQ